MALDTIALSNSVRLLAAIFFVIAALKAFLLSRETLWDGWGLMSLGIALLAVASLLTIFRNLGLQFVNAGEILTAVAGVLAASAFLMSTKLIRKAGK